MDNYQLLPTFWIENPSYNWDSLGDGQSHECKKGEKLFIEGMKMEHIYLIKKGKVKLSITNENGDEKTVGFIGKNSIVGTSSLFNNAQYMFNASAVTNTLLLKYDKSAFINKVLKNEELMIQVFKIMSLRIRILTDHALDLSFNHSYKRLAKALFDLSKTYGKRQDDGSVFIDFEITQQEIGEIIGTTWVTVSHNLKKLSEKGIIKKKGKNYIILNYSGLKEISL